MEQTARNHGSFYGRAGSLADKHVRPTERLENNDAQKYPSTNKQQLSNFDFLRIHLTKNTARDLLKMALLE